MSIVKDIIIKVIDSKTANDFIKKYHYSGKVVHNSSLHFGAFYNNRLHGVMSYGTPMDKRKMLPLVENTLWNEMLELNRMAFDNFLPKNSESRCLAISFKLLKKNAPHIKWILSFSDGCQSGDGTIYRASGFILTQIRKNKTILNYNGRIVADLTLNTSRGKDSASNAKKKGAYPIDGFQLRYIKLLHNGLKLNCEILPYSEINKMNAGMYKGIKKGVSGVESDISGVHPEEGGAVPTDTLQNINGEIECQA